MHEREEEAFGKLLAGERTLTAVENVKKEEKEYLRTKAEKSRKLSDLTVGEFEEMLKAVVKEKALGGVEVN